MNKKQADRRPHEKPAEQGAGKNPSKPGSGRAPEGIEEDKGFGKPKQFPEPGTQGGGKDSFDGERSDRESGRPVQLEDDEEGQPFSPGAKKPGFAGRKPEDRQDRAPREVEPKR